MFGLLPAQGCVHVSVCPAVRQSLRSFPSIPTSFIAKFHLVFLLLFLTNACLSSFSNHYPSFHSSLTHSLRSLVHFSSRPCLHQPVCRPPVPSFSKARSTRMTQICRHYISFRILENTCSWSRTSAFVSEGWKSARTRPLRRITTFSWWDEGMESKGSEMNSEGHRDDRYGRAGLTRAWNQSECEKDCLREIHIDRRARKEGRKMERSEQRRSINIIWNFGPQAGQRSTQKASMVGRALESKHSSSYPSLYEIESGTRNQGTQEPRNLGTKEPRNQGTKEPRTMELRRGGPKWCRVSWNMGTRNEGTN